MESDLTPANETPLSKLADLAKKIPILPHLYRLLRDWYVSKRLRSKSAEHVFTDIYRKNTWRGTESVSGLGSDTFQTRILLAELPVLFRELEISTILDIPCGDFHWMKTVDLGGIDYLGADIVGELIQQNNELHGRGGIRFQKMDLINDELPRVDLVFCRDCLVHLSFDDILRALNNVCASRSKYLLTTTFTERSANLDISTGQWRVLNLERAPFRLPAPLRIIQEGCTESNGAYTDKAVGLWRIDDLREHLARA